MENEEGPSLMANHETVPGSALTKGNAERRNSATASSLPGFAFSGTYRAYFVITYSCTGKLLPLGERPAIAKPSFKAVCSFGHRSGGPSDGRLTSSAVGVLRPLWRAERKNPVVTGLFLSF